MISAMARNQRKIEKWYEDWTYGYWENPGHTPHTLWCKFAGLNPSHSDNRVNEDGGVHRDGYYIDDDEFLGEFVEWLCENEYMEE